MELQILHWFQTLHSGILDPIMVCITKLGDKGLFWILLAVVLMCTKKYRRAGATMMLALIFSVIFCNGLMKNLVARPRPFWVDSTFNLLVKAPTDYSFPSGHTSASFAAALGLFMWHKREGIGAIILAALIALSRLYLTVHYPTDVLVSLILGSLYGIIAFLVIRYICKRSDRFRNILVPFPKRARVERQS